MEVIETKNGTKIKLITGEVFYLSDVVAISPMYTQALMNDNSGKVAAFNYVLDVQTSEGFTVRAELLVMRGHPHEEANKQLAPQLKSEGDLLQEKLLSLPGFKQLASGHVLDVTKIRSVTGVREIPYPAEMRVHESSFDVMFKGGAVLLISNKQDLRGLNKQEEAVVTGAIKELHQEVSNLWEQE